MARNLRTMFWIQWFCILLVCMVDRFSCEVVVHSVTMGKTSWGDWSDEIICPDGAKVKGLRLQVEEKQGFSGDDTALNGIQLACDNDDDTDEIKGPFGEWNDWVQCLDEHYITGFNFRSEGRQSVLDDVAGVNVKMICNDGEELDGDGIDEWGTWDKSDYEKCPLNSYFCGVQAQIEHDTYGDHTSLNKMKFLCCSTGWSTWSTWTGCSHSCGEGIRKRKRSCTNGQLCMTSQDKKTSTEFQSESCKIRDCQGCLRENGFCATENGSDQNEGVKKLNDVDGDSTDAQNECLESCLAHNGATGCEVIWNQANRGCYVHTKQISKGNGAPRHYCWIFSKCSDTARCDLIRCNKDDRPVCGSDGVTYRNKCTLDIAICKDRSIELDHHEACGPSSCELMMCTEEYSPVCASNRKTYSNNCTLEIANCKDHNIKFIHNGGCSDPTYCDMKVCPSVYRPVCAFNGKTYSNNCTLGIAKCKDRTINFMHNGRCAKPCKKMCAEIHAPVCGLNGVTYSNKCELKNAICDDSKIKLAYKGKCGGLGLTKCRRERNIEGTWKIVGRFVPQCTSEGLYEVLQYHGSTGYSWCANQYSGKEIAGTRRGPGDERLSIPKCIAAVHVGLIGVWRYTSKNGGSETHRISADGKVKREDGNGKQLGFANLAPSNSQRHFPTSKGWLMMIGLHGKLTSQYIRWNKDDTVDTHHFCLGKCEQVVDFCESSCDARYDRSANFYCCAAKGIKKLSKVAAHRGKKGKYTFSLQLEVMEGDIKHYDVIVTELGSEPRFPRDNPHSYTNEEIEDNVDGLYVAGRVADEESFGKIFVVGESDGRSRRSLAEPENRPLRKDTYYGVFVRGYITEDDYTTSSWYPPVKAYSEKSAKWKTAIAVVVVVAVFAIVVILFIIHHCKKRKNSLKDASNHASGPVSNPAYIPDYAVQDGEHNPNFTPHQPPPYDPTKNVNIDNFAAGVGADLNEKPGIPNDENYERINRVVPNVYEIAADPNSVDQDYYDDSPLDDTTSQPNVVRANQTEDESWKVRPRPRPARKEHMNENNNIERSGIPQASPTNPFRSDLYEPNYQDPSIHHPVVPFTGAGDTPESFYHEIGTPTVKYNVPTGVTFISPNTPPPDYSELNNTVPPQPVNFPMPGYNRLDNSTISHNPMIQPAYSELHQSTDQPRPCNEPVPGYNKLKNTKSSPYEQISGIPEGTVALPRATDSAFMGSGVDELNNEDVDNASRLYDNPQYSVPVMQQNNPTMVGSLAITNDVVNNADSNA